MSGIDRSTQFVSFFLADEEYAVDILRAREIVEHDVITRVPMAPAGVRGVLNLRGRVVPVIDLAIKLGLPPTEPTRWTCILMVEVTLDGEATLVGMMIDAVGEVIDLPPADIEPPPPFGVRVRLDYLAGVGKVGKKIVLLLDVERILSQEELHAAASIRPEAGEPAAGEPGSASDRPADAEPSPMSERPGGLRLEVPSAEAAPPEPAGGV